jgi:hypothetical protein
VESRSHWQSGFVARGENRDCFTYVRNDDRGADAPKKMGTDTSAPRPETCLYPFSVTAEGALLG